MGMMILPNGNGGMMLIPTPSAPSAPEPPSEYSGSYLTDNDVRVDVTYRTANKALADDYEAKLMQSTGWKVAPPLAAEPEKPVSLAADIATNALAIVVIAVIITAAVFFGAIVLQIADLIEFRTIDAVVRFTIRALLVGGPLSFLIISALTLREHSSRKALG